MWRVIAKLAHRRLPVRESRFRNRTSGIEAQERRYRNRTSGIRKPESNFGGSEAQEANFRSRETGILILPFARGLHT